MKYKELHNQRSKINL